MRSILPPFIPKYLFLSLVSFFVPDSVAGFDLIRGCHFLQNMAASSGGALVHAGVMEEVSDTVFEGNGAGNEGPAVLSLGLLDYMGAVTFDSNEFFCEEGKFSTETRVGSDASKVSFRYKINLYFFPPFCCRLFAFFFFFMLLDLKVFAGFCFMRPASDSEVDRPRGDCVK